MHRVVICPLDWSNSFVNIIIKLQPNLSTMAILGTEKSGSCREVAISRSLIISYFTADRENIYCIRVWPIIFTTQTFPRLSPWTIFDVVMRRIMVWRILSSSKPPSINCQSVLTRLLAEDCKRTYMYICQDFHDIFNFWRGPVNKNKSTWLERML